MMVLIYALLFFFFFAGLVCSAGGAAGPSDGVGGRVVADLAGAGRWRERRGRAIGRRCGVTPARIDGRVSHELRVGCVPVP